mgnify:CR=1 FL=1
MSFYVDPEPRTEPEEEKEWGHCSKCGGEIWPGETVGVLPEGGFICSDCVDDEWGKLDTGTKLSLLGCDIVYAAAAPRRRRRYF